MSRRRRSLGLLRHVCGAAVVALCTVQGAARAQDAADPAPPGPATDQELELREELERLRQRLAQLEERVDAGATGGAAPSAGPGPGAPGEGGAPVGRLTDQEQQTDSRLVVRPQDRPLTGQDLIDQEFPKSWPLFGSDYRMSFGGYVKVDLLHDFGGTGDRFQMVTSTVPVNEDRDGYSNLFARESRFHFDVRKTVPGAPPQKFYLEMDFFDEAEGAFENKPRLRHAYFVVGRLLGGWTWSTLLDVRSLPNLIDFAGGDAIAGGRTAQVRFEDKLSETAKWAVAIESQDFSGIDDVAMQGGKAETGWPRLAARVVKEWRWGFTLVGGQLGSLQWDGEGVGPDASALQWVLAFSGRFQPGRRDYLVWNASIGEGAADSVINFIGTSAGAVLTADGDLDTVPVWNVALGYGHHVTDSLGLNLGLAWAQLVPSDLRADDTMKAGGTAHANLIWAATQDLSTGIEYSRGMRVNKDGADGASDRVQMMIKYAF